ncbi:MAG: nitroreductase family protein [Bacteroidales bacterium]|nr:nitroreductase family protein [Bacteroidales bacterium]
MNFLELIKIRQSVRKYSDKNVETEKIEKCIEAARLAPSASNAQPWKFIVVNNPELKNKIANDTFSTVVPFNKFTLQAPVIIVVTIEKPNVMSMIGSRLKNKEYKLIDIGIATEHFCLQATELGLGTCILGWFNENKIKKILNIPKKKTIGVLITLGYPCNEYIIRDKKRKNTDEIRTYNKY